jgi:hypothetical protein
MTPDDRQWLTDRFDQLDRRLDRMAVRDLGRETRLRSLETWRGWLTGALAVVGAVIGWVATQIGK